MEELWRNGVGDSLMFTYLSASTFFPSQHWKTSNSSLSHPSPAVFNIYTSDRRDHKIRNDT